MAIAKSFKQIEWEYVHRFTSGPDRSRTCTYPTPKISDIPQIQTQLIACIESNNLFKFRELLTGDFIIKDLQQTQRTGRLHINNSREQQGDYYTHRLYEVRPVYEQLLLFDRASAFKTLLEMAQDKPEFVQALQATFTKLDFANDEGVEFNFDISGTSFMSAKLGCSRFNCVDNVNFDHADLRFTEITQQQLDQSARYANANIPNGLWHWWDDEMISGIRERLAAIDAYADLCLPANNEKRSTISNFYHQQSEILSLNKQPTSLEKKSMVDCLKDLRKTTGTHRSLSYLIGEAISFILLAVVGYVVVSAYRKYAHGHFGIFTQPKSDHMVEGAQRYISCRG